MTSALAAGLGNATGVSASGIIIAGWLLLRVSVLFRRRRRRAGKPVTPIHPLVRPSSDGTRGSTRVPPLNAIELTRELVGPPPRAFAAELRDYIRARPPAWLAKRKDDPMNMAFKDQDLIRRNGKVVWARIVQANMLIFKPGPTDHGGEVVWSPDAHFDRHPEDLTAISRELFNLKGTDQADPEAAAFARMLANELTRGLRMPVPKRFTCGRVVYQSSVMFTRRHLPSGYVTRNLLLAFAHPDPNGALLLLPAAFWPASLTQWWNEKVK